MKNILVFFVVIAGSMVNVMAETPTGEEILAKSWQAMGVAAHYKILAKGMEMSVYQKPLPDGSIAMLTDISTPIKKTTIKYGDKSYDLYLDKKIAIDTHVLFAGAKDLPEFAPLVSAMKDVKTGSNLLRTFSYNGQECYEIEQNLQNSASLLTNLLPAMAKNIPVKNRFVIDAETFLMQEQESFNVDGSRISKIQYLDFEPMPDLTDEIFQLPEGFEVLSPKTIGEYTAVIMDIVSPKSPPIDIDVEFERAKKRIEKEHPMRTREMIEKTLPVISLPIPPPAQIARHQYDYLMPEKPKRPWGIIITVNVILIAVIIWLVYRKRKKD